MFLAINTSSVQLIPASAIALLAAGGSSDPTGVVFLRSSQTACSTAAGIIAASLLSRLRRFRQESGEKVRIMMGMHELSSMASNLIFLLFLVGIPVDGSLKG